MMSHSPADDESRLIAQMSQLRRRVRRLLVAEQLARLGAQLLAVLLVAVLVEHSLTRSSWEAQPYVSLVTFVTVAVLVLSRVAILARRPVALHELAMALERRFPDWQDRMQAAVQFARQRSEALSPGERELVRDAEAFLQQRLASPLNHPALRTGAAAAAGATGFIIAIAMLFPGSLDAAMRSVITLGQSRRALLVRDWRIALIHEQGEQILAPESRTTVPANEPLSLRIEGPQPERAMLEVTRLADEDDAGETETAHFPAEVGARFDLTLREGNWRLRARDGSLASPPVFVDALPRPKLDRLTVEISAPSYTGRPPWTLAPGISVADAPVGSKVRVNLEFDQPVCVTGTGVDGRSLTAVDPELHGGAASWIDPFDLTRPGTYEVAYDVRSHEGLALKDRPAIRIESLPDAPPQLTLRVQPNAETVAPTQRLVFLLEAADDHGLTEAKLQLTRDGTLLETLALPLSERAPSASGKQMWRVPVDLQPLALAVGDRLQVFAIAQDTAPETNTGRSNRLEFAVVTPAQQASDLLAGLKAVRADIESAVAAFRAANGDHPDAAAVERELLDPLDGIQARLAWLRVRYARPVSKEIAAAIEGVEQRIAAIEEQAPGRKIPPAGTPGRDDELAWRADQWQDVRDALRSVITSLETATDLQGIHAEQSEIHKVTQGLADDPQREGERSGLAERQAAIAEQLRRLSQRLFQDPSESDDAAEAAQLFQAGTAAGQIARALENEQWNQAAAEQQDLLTSLEEMEGMPRDVPGATGDATGAAGELAGGDAAAELSEVPRDPEVQPSGDAASLDEGIWGHLPSRLQQEMEAALRDEFGSRYNEAIRRYFETLASEPAR